MSNISLNSICLPSEDVVAREIQGEIIIIPLTAGIGETEDDLYTLNETGRAIWRLLDGKISVKQVIDSLGREYDESMENIQTDVIGMLEEMLRQHFILTK